METRASLEKVREREQLVEGVGASIWVGTLVEGRFRRLQSGLLWGRGADGGVEGEGGGGLKVCDCMSRNRWAHCNCYEVECVGRLREMKNRSAS
jgi:hypothetical protein